MSRRGSFITFEGGEGTGKSTQAAFLADWLRGRGKVVTLTREPGGSPRAEAIRELLLGGKVAPFGPGAEAVLFAVARTDHVTETIRPALERGEWVISDRFMDSTVAYQGAAGVEEAELLRLQKLAVGDTLPDLTLVLDIPAEEGLARAKARGGAADRFEQDAVPIHEARRQAFLRIAAANPTRCVVVEASRPPDQIAADVRAAVELRLAISEHAS